MITLPRHNRAVIDAQINIVPYIDVMLVLLVIFMMTTPIIEQGIEVDLPTAEANAVDFTEQPPTIITVNKNSKYFINSPADGGTEINEGDHLPLGIIAARVQARLQIYPQMQVFVRGDREVEYGAVIALMSFLQKNGVDKIGIITESPDVK